MQPSEVYPAVAQLLQALASSDNHIRGRAEEQLTQEWVQKRPEMLLMALIEQIQGASEPSMRSFAAVLFRRVAAKPRQNPVSKEQTEVYLSLPEEQRLPIRQNLLRLMTEESLPHVRHKIGDAVAELARELSDEGLPWPELLAVLFQASQSSEPSQRENAFRVFAATPGVISEEHEGMVLNVFTKGFKDNEVAVRLAAMEAFAAFLRQIGKKSLLTYYPLAPEILNILPPLKDAQDSDNLTKALQALIELAELAPRMFRPLFHNLLRFSITVIQDKELEDITRQNALELMATFADHASQMCKKDPLYASEMVTQCLSLMTDVGMDDDDGSEWNALEDLEIDESDENHVAGEQCMDRLAVKLGGDSILLPAFNWLPRMMASSAWRDRHAALMAISAISEGCREMMEEKLDQVLALVVPALRDPHPRVRWAGCNALGQMSTDFAGTMQAKYHRIIMANLLPVLDSAEPRVQAHAAAALVNFCEQADRETVDPYLDSVLIRLVGLLKNPKRFVQEQALSTIATIADAAQVAFARYYDSLMPWLFEVLRADTPVEARLLRAKAMECATLIALAVGKEKMGHDAFALVQLLGSIQHHITDDDDPQSSYLMHCWGRMCRVLGQDFVPYLPGVMPPLLETAKARADLKLLDHDDDAIADHQAEDGWELVPVRGKLCAIRTGQLEDKYTAIELITVYARILEGAFEPYVVEIMEKVSLPGLSFFFHDPTRVSSAKSIPPLLSAYLAAHGARSEPMAELWRKTAQKLIEILAAEPTTDTLAELFQAFYGTVDIMGPSCLSDEHMALFIDSAKTTLEDYQTRVKYRQEAREAHASSGGGAGAGRATDGIATHPGDDGGGKDGDDDDDDLPLEHYYAMEDDQTLLSDVNKAFHNIFKHHGAVFLPHWERLLPIYHAFLRNDNDVAAHRVSAPETPAAAVDTTSSEAGSQRQWALCLFDDVLEFCPGEASFAYREHMVDPIMTGLRSHAPGDRQAAAYGVGVAAQHGGEIWSAFVTACIPALFQAAARSPDPDEDNDHACAAENACAAIAKIMLYNASQIMPNQIPSLAQHWVDTLPILQDAEVAPYAYSFLARLIEQQSISITSQPAKIFAHIARALEAQTLQGAAASQAVTAAKQLLALSAGTLGLDPNAIFTQLPTETQEAVRPWFL
ncbi:MAG: hypothetical protein M1826_006371 [Phylliscum demangeonii]|nr:MAG: hypothetical protein M1826_006371 [Phylliscum demangeonii]